jgi:AraC-like DNA-binding protein
MISKLYIPAFPLNQFIKSFFYYTGFEPQHEIDRLLPDGNVQLIFDLTEYPKYIYDNYSLKEIQSCKKVWFSGFRTEPITIPSGKESEMLIVQFEKGKAYPFLSEPMHALTNYVIDAELVLKKDILDLRDQLKEVPYIETKFLFLENYLLKQYGNGLHDNPFVDFMISEISSAPNMSRLQQLSEKTGYSQKHVIHIFKNLVGVTPKSFLRITRFQKAVFEIENQRQVNWTSLAFDCGYYDQSHFIADFKNFSGFTPVQYLEHKRYFLNYIPILDRR